MEKVISIAGQFLTELWALTGEMAPYLLIGFLFAGMLKVFFPGHLIRRFAGRSSFRSALNASLLGVPMPLCSCGVLPAGISFYKSGASRGSTVSFLVSTPQTGVDSIIATYALLGLPLAIIRPIVALISGVFGGVLTNRFGSSQDSKQVVNREEDEQGPRTMKEMFRYGFVEMMQDITKWLVIGLLVAAFLSVIIPEGFFTEQVSNAYLSMILILLASVPLYVCATGSIPIAAVLLMKGLSPGAALVFLMAGPATNAATMAVISNSMGRKTLWLYLVSIIGGALFFGTVINEVIPRGWIMNSLPENLHTGAHHEQLGWWKIASAVMLIALMVNGYIQQLLQRRRTMKKENNHESTSDHKIYRVEGMTCNHCKATVEKGLHSLHDVEEVFADPDKNRVQITGGVYDDKQVQQKVEELGYVYKGEDR